ncbi:MAG TPA: hypothetical protein VMU34_02280 [Mycobacterium sp.]|nr:hypothetical protein [Mycobacterium sp.]
MSPSPLITAALVPGAGLLAGLPGTRLNMTSRSIVQLAAHPSPPTGLQWTHRLSGQSASLSQAASALPPNSHTP